MKPFRIIFSSIGSLGIFGGILLIITCIVLGTWIASNAVNQPAMTIHNELSKLQILEGEVGFYLLEMDILADYYIFSAGDDYYSDEYLANDQLLREALDDLYYEFLGTSEEDLLLYQELQIGIDEHNQAFAQIQEALAAGDRNQLAAAKSELDEKTEQAKKIITDWSYQINANQIKAINDQNSVVDIITILSVLCLGSIPFLAFWAFRQINNLTHPILILSDVLVSMRGEQVDKERLSQVTDRTDNLGQFARDVETMYATASDRLQALEEELILVRQQIQEERRRKRG
jgi:hypothetical protein